MTFRPLVRGLLSLLLAATVPASAGDVIAFKPRASARPPVPALAKPGSAAIGTFDTAALNRPSISITLPGGRTVTARQTHLLQTARGRTWEGDVVDRDEWRGKLTLTAHQAVVTGVLVYDGAIHELRPAGAGETVLFEVDEARLPPEAPPRDVSAASRLKAQAEPAATLAATGPAVHDLLVFTTAATRNRYGAGLDGMIANAVALANSAYRAGALELTLNLVDIRVAAFTEGSRMEDTLDLLEADPDVRAARDALGADLVLAISENGEYCGIANLLPVTTGMPSTAFGVVYSGCLGTTTLAHEVGHLQGLLHDRDNSIGNAPATPYGYGYRVCAVGGFRDIMSYACPSISVTRVSEFSNPRKLWNDIPFGIDYELSPATAADAVRAISVTANVIAGYRASRPVEVPTAPSGLLALATPGQAESIDLTWVDTSNVESGFAIERSKDGVAWVEIARVGSNVTAYADRTVTGGITYQYRVRAYNSTGTSSASNVATATPVGADTSPDPFLFQARTDVAPSQPITSNSITVSGINVPVAISVANGTYSIGCDAGSFTTATGTIASGQTACVRHTSAAAAGTSVTTTLTIGAVSGTFTSETARTPVPPPATGNSREGSGDGGGGGALDPVLLANLLSLVCLARVRRRARRAAVAT